MTVKFHEAKILRTIVDQRNLQRRSNVPIRVACGAPIYGILATSCRVHSAYASPRDRASRGILRARTEQRHDCVKDDRDASNRHSELEPNIRTNFLEGNYRAHPSSSITTPMKLR